MANITITDFAGRVVMNQNSKVVAGDNRLKLDVSGLKQGVYLLRTLVDDKVNVTKLMIQ
jgi:hypothetical protein